MSEVVSGRPTSGTLRRIALAVGATIVSIAAAATVIWLRPPYADYHAPPLNELTVLHREYFDHVPAAPTWRTAFAPPATAADVSTSSSGLRLGSTGASYFWTRQPKVHAVSLVVSFAGDQGGDSDGAGLAFSKKTGATPGGPDGVFTNSVVIGVRRAGLSVGIFDGKSLRNIGHFALPIKAGKTYAVVVARVDQDKLRLWVPELKFETTVSDSAIATYWGPTVVLTQYQPDGPDQSTEAVLQSVSIYRLKGAQPPRVRG